MSKIIGVTVGTPTSPSKMEEELKPVKTVNGVAPDENGNVNVAGGGSTPDLSGYAKKEDIPSLYGYAKTDDIPSALPNPNALTFTGAVQASYDGSKPMSVEIPVSYSKSQIDAIMGSYITDIDNLVGGEG